MNLRLLPLIAACALWGCAADPSTDNSEPTPDAGVEQPPPDAGTESLPDAGTEPIPDAGTEPPPDAGVNPPRAIVFPQEDATWPTVAPSAAGWDTAKLNAVLDFVGSRDTRAFVIVQDGKLVAERYWNFGPNLRRDIASAQKAVVAILVGIAVDKQLLTLDESVSGVLGEGWSNADATSEARITVRHLLTMSSGLSLSLRRVAAPGTTWLYNNDAYHRLRHVLEARTGKDIQSLSEEWLFDALGARNSQWQERADLDSMGLPLWGLHMSARDLARFGLLMQARGAWNGVPVVSPAQVDLATHSSQALNPAYGHLFWLNGQAFSLVPPASTRVDGPMLPSAPPDLFAGLGKDDQKVYVVPSLGLVVTRLGAQAGERGTEALSDFDDTLWAMLMDARL
ncbi:serine hydrolase domain-containing protein [Corallococcus macrosporus]|uniref:Serine hydrolase n=1 Tax=Corallococcus macrosporus DSM 14697 TaxID=1189310 RepID=A0A250K0Y5_9BACT|nr:serine hydrolase domain-containing protein [Corallococcus macrosporus]ATB49663.1 serine hydrolase [Corallococcus macrosporus DSM 14697]